MQLDNKVFIAYLQEKFNELADSGKKFSPEDRVIDWMLSIYYDEYGWGAPCTTASEFAERWSVGKTTAWKSMKEGEKRIEKEFAELMERVRFRLHDDRKENEEVNAKTSILASDKRFPGGKVNVPLNELEKQPEEDIIYTRVHAQKSINISPKGDTTTSAIEPPFDRDKAIKLVGSACAQYVILPQALEHAGLSREMLADEILAYYGARDWETAKGVKLSKKSWKHAVMNGWIMPKVKALSSGSSPARVFNLNTRETNAKRTNTHRRSNTGSSEESTEELFDRYFSSGD